MQKTKNNVIKMNKPELLAPCGDYECFLSAINNGADAVYLSGDKFGARAYAKNFSEEELIEAIDYAHLFGAKVYLTINTLIKETEIKEVFEYLLPMYKAGLDAVIVQDIGCIAYIMKMFPDLPVHGSTQMAITGSEGVELLKDMGLTRVVLARELSMEEIDRIHEDTGIELECFVHGALCYSYSGKCLFSSLVGGRSGNRGRCAGPCRQPYNNEEYLLSTKDISCLKLIPKLCNGSIASFKIEGRMKSPEYVAGVTAIYRKHIDRYYSLVKKYGVDKASDLFYSDKSLEKDYNTLISLYTRGGNSEGYYYKHNGKDMISIKDASYKSAKGEATDNDEVSLKENKIKVSAYASFYKGNEAMLSLSTKNYSVSVSAGQVMESNNRALDYDTVKKQISKTGNTAFLIEDLTCDIEDNSFVKISDLNELRRLALDALKAEILSEFKRNIPIDICGIENDVCFDDMIANNVSDNLEKIVPSKVVESDSAGNTKKNSKNKTSISAEVISTKQINSILNNENVDSIYIPWNILRDDITIADTVAGYGKRLYIKFPSVIRHNFFKENENILNQLLSIAVGVLIDNFETFKYLKNRDFRGEYLGDIHVYALNNLAKLTLNKMGFGRLTVPVELNKKEILSGDYIGDELIVYGRLPMMISAQCVNSTLKGCNHKTTRHNIKDRTNAEFVCINDCSTCNNTIYNGIPLSLHGENDFVNRVKPSSIRFIFTDENEADIDGIIEYVLTGNKSLEKYINKFTRGHLNRGVL